MPGLQACTASLIVGVCLAYAVWILLPRGARRASARVLLALPWPAATAARLRKVAQAPASGCGCDGCDRKALPRPAGQPGQPLVFQPRPRR